MLAGTTTRAALSGTVAPEFAKVGIDHILSEGLRIEAECFNRSIFQPETSEGLRRFLDRNHPDRTAESPALTPGLVRDGGGGEAS